MACIELRKLYPSLHRWWLPGFVARARWLRGDPFALLWDVFERLPSHPADRLAELLPDAWFAAHSNSRRQVAS
jgi:hypothetical protein